MAFPTSLVIHSDDGVRRLWEIFLRSLVVISDVLLGSCLALLRVFGSHPVGGAGQRWHVGTARQVGVAYCLPVFDSLLCTSSPSFLSVACVFDGPTSPLLIALVANDLGNWVWKEIREMVEAEKRRENVKKPAIVLSFKAFVRNMDG